MTHECKVNYWYQPSTIIVCVSGDKLNYSKRNAKAYFCYLVDLFLAVEDYCLFSWFILFPLKKKQLQLG